VDQLKRLQATHAGAGLTVLAIHDASAKPDELRMFMTERGLSFPVARAKPDEADGWLSTAFVAYGVESVPTAFLIDRKGVLRYQGALDGVAAEAARLLK
jgi:hypothetical protein